MGHTDLTSASFNPETFERQIENYIKDGDLVLRVAAVYNGPPEEGCRFFVADKSGHSLEVRMPKDDIAKGEVMPLLDAIYKGEPTQRMREQIKAFKDMTTRPRVSFPESHTGHVTELLTLVGKKLTARFYVRERQKDGSNRVFSTDVTAFDSRNVGMFGGLPAVTNGKQSVLRVPDGGLREFETCLVETQLQNLNAAILEKEATQKRETLVERLAHAVGRSDTR